MPFFNEKKKDPHEVVQSSTTAQHRFLYTTDIPFDKFSIKNFKADPVRLTNFYACSIYLAP